MRYKKEQFSQLLEQFRKRVIPVLLVLGLVGVSPVFAEEKCEPVDKKSIKIEGFISKSYRKQRKQVFQEFGEIGSTRVALRVYPMGETSKVIAVGPEQVQQLLQQDLSNEEFHKLYRKMSIPNELTPIFGLQVPNVKIAKPN